MNEVILLAQEKSNSWGFAVKIKDYIKDKWKLDVPLYNLGIHCFRNHECLPEVKENVRKKDIYFINDSSKDPNYAWSQLLLIKDLLNSASAHEITFVLPNMPYSRQDRKDKPHVPISARAFASSISPGLHRVITMDLHAPQVQGFYPSTVPLDNLYSFRDAVNYLKQNPGNKNLEELVIVSPDSGGVGRADAFAKKMQSINPTVFTVKRRIKRGEVAKMQLTGDVKDKDVLIVDDIIDSGNTLISAYNELKDNGARDIWCYGTHGIFTENAHENLPRYFNRVITTNTIAQKDNQVEVVDVSSTFGETIYRAQKGISISELFE